MIWVNKVLLKIIIHPHKTIGRYSTFQEIYMQSVAFFCLLWICKKWFSSHSSGLFVELCKQFIFHLFVLFGMYKFSKIQTIETPYLMDLSDIFTIVFTVASLVLTQSYNCPIVSKESQKGMSILVTWILSERYYIYRTWLHILWDILDMWNTKLQI